MLIFKASITTLKKKENKSPPNPKDYRRQGNGPTLI